MADFRHHYKKRHFKDNKPCAGVKLKLIPKSVDKTSTHKHKHKTKSKTTSSPSPPKESRSKDKDKDSKKKLKTKVNPNPISSTPGPSGVIKGEVTVTKTPISSTCSSATSAGVMSSPSKPKFLPQCKICTFMPLVDPYNAIDSHMRLEHKITGDTTSHVKVVFNPKAT
ncbi:unnamed protein product [Oppiella nova]|uniref:Uncharacterized protein n=1 Tax=Oppiella nova TaxID=334625 RepID=A0A7R9QXN3_9ACAR|nr:unnamed protein product [Oppiella nova]CAG2179410.1 unnamed protein product [Oppiella nova]